MRVLHYGKLEDLQARFGHVNAIEPLPTAELTRPALVLNPHRHARKSGTGTGAILSFDSEI